MAFIGGFVGVATHGTFGVGLCPCPASPVSPPAGRVHGDMRFHFLQEGGRESFITVLTHTFHAHFSYLLTLSFFCLYLHVLFTPLLPH